MKTFILGIALFIVSTGTVTAQDTWLSFDGGLKVIEGAAGMGLNGKLSLQQGNFFAEINPLDLTLVPGGAKEGYRSETLSDGRDVCRDTSNGQFADKSNCVSLDVFYAFSANVNYFIKRQEFMIYAGPGYRLGDATTPYLNVGVIFDPDYMGNDYHWFGKTSMGKGFFEASAGVSITI